MCGSLHECLNWEPGEPNNSEPNDSGWSEECVEAYMSAGMGWNDNECSVYRHWICKMPRGEWLMAILKFKNKRWEVVFHSYSIVLIQYFECRSIHTLFTKYTQ